MKAVPILALTAKWLLVPALFGVAGYYIVGPQIGAVAPKTASAQTAPNPLDDPAPKFTGKGPDVEIKSRRGASFTGTKKTTKRRRKKKKAPPTTTTTDAPAAASPAGGGSTGDGTTGGGGTDGGGGGGATDGGGGGATDGGAGTTGG